MLEKLMGSTGGRFCRRREGGSPWHLLGKGGVSVGRQTPFTGFVIVSKAGVRSHLQLDGSKGQWEFSQQVEGRERKSTVMVVAFEGTMLSEISQTEEDHYRMILLVCGIWKKPNSWKQRTGCWLPASGGEGWEKWMKVVRSYEVPVPR